MDIAAIDIETTCKQKRASPYLDNILLVTVNDGKEVRASSKPTDFVNIFRDPDILKLFQNGSFDIQFLQHSIPGLEITNIWDTMVAERVLTAGLNADCSLGGIVQKYCGVALNKSIRDTFMHHRGRLSNTQLEYAKNDVRYLIDVYNQQKVEIDKRGMDHVMELENALVLVVASMELEGIGFDSTVWDEILKEETKLLPHLELEAQLALSGSFQLDLLGGIRGTVNLNSWHQLIPAFRRLGITLQDTRQDTLEKCAHPAAKKVLAYKEHLGRTRWDYPQYVNPVTKRIHPDYNQIGASTGRFSCSDPNLQNVPRDAQFRRMFVSRSGYKFVSADYSQQELRVLAELCEDFALRKACRGDPHLANARLIFADPTIQKNDERRRIAKNCNFALVYGAGLKGFATTAGIPIDKARGPYQRLKRGYPKVDKWGRKSWEFLRNNGYAKTISGRRRYFLGVTEHPDRYVTVARNTPIQGSSADMTKLAMVYTHEAIKEYRAKIVLSVHDEIMVECPEDCAHKVKGVLEDAMRRAGEFYVHSVPIEAEATIMNVWRKE